MMRIAPAAKAFVYARANPVSRNMAFTALRMMSSAAPAVKVRVGNPLCWDVSVEGVLLFKYWSRRCSPWRLECRPRCRPRIE